MTLRLQSVTGELEGICTFDEMLLRDVNERRACAASRTHLPACRLAGQHVLCPVQVVKHLHTTRVTAANNNCDLSGVNDWADGQLLTSASSGSSTRPTAEIPNERQKQASPGRESTGSMQATYLSCRRLVYRLTQRLFFINPPPWILTNGFLDVAPLFSTLTRT